MTATAYTALARIAGGSRLSLSVHIKRTSFNGNKKNVYYEISDPFIRFYYRFIYPYLLDIDQGLGKRFIK